MGINGEKAVEYLVVDTTAFIQNAPLQVIVLLNLILYVYII